MRLFGLSDIAGRAPHVAGALALAIGIMAPSASAQVFPPTIELRSLSPAAGGDGTEGFVVAGVQANDLSGSAVSGAGDINGDGIQDVIVGAPGADPDVRPTAGETYVVFGRATGFPGQLELRTLLPTAGGDGSLGFVLKGVSAGDESGHTISGAGDVNGDGIDDLIIGAHLADLVGRSGAGESYVVFGRSTGFPAAFQLRSLFPDAGGDGSEGFVVKGVYEGDISGASVSGAGDVNGDGIDDLIIGAQRGGLQGPGTGYVVFGRATGFPAVFDLRNLLPLVGGDGSEGFVIKGVESGDDLGKSVSDAGDVNGDGIDDLIIGAYRPYGDTGASYVVFGRTTGFPGVFKLRSLFPSDGGDGSEGFVIRGVDGGDRSGYWVSGAGDVNDDSIDDLIIGTQNANQSYVVFGRATGFPGVIDLRSLFPAAGGDGSEGFVLRGIDEFDDLGRAVSSAGDVNGDGVDDLIVGGHRADPNDRLDAGESYVVFGRAAGFPAVFELRSLLPAAGGDGSEGVVLRGADGNDQSGYAVGGAGDVNGDTIADIIIGARNAAPTGLSEAGGSYVVFGRAP